MSRPRAKSKGRAAPQRGAAQAPGPFRASLDGGVLTAALIPILLGVVMSYSSTATLDLDASIPPLFAHHVGALAIGLCAALAAFVFPTGHLKRIAVPLWLLSLALLALTALFGVQLISLLSSKPVTVGQGASSAACEPKQSAGGLQKSTPNSCFLRWSRGDDLAKHLGCCLLQSRRALIRLWGKLLDDPVAGRHRCHVGTVDILNANASEPLERRVATNEDERNFVWIGFDRSL